MKKKSKNLQLEILAANEFHILNSIENAVAPEPHAMVEDEPNFIVGGALNGALDAVNIFLSSITRKRVTLRGPRIR